MCVLTEKKLRMGHLADWLSCRYNALLKFKIDTDPIQSLSQSTVFAVVVGTKSKYTDIHNMYANYQNILIERMIDWAREYTQKISVF